MFGFLEILLNYIFLKRTVIHSYVMLCSLSSFFTGNQNMHWPVSPPHVLCLLPCDVGQGKVGPWGLTGSKLNIFPSNLQFLFCWSVGWEVISLQPSLLAAPWEADGRIAFCWTWKGLTGTILPLVYNFSVLICSTALVMPNLISR